MPGLIVFGIGLMIMVAPLTTALMTSVPKHNAGVASAVNNAISRVGPQLAGALIFVAGDHRLPSRDLTRSAAGAAGWSLVSRLAHRPSVPGIA